MPPFLRDCAALLSRWHGDPERNEIEQGEATADAIPGRDTASWAIRAVALTLIAALALVFLRSALVAPDVADRMLVVGNDSIMRLLSVRDWLNGQGWFDMSNGRVLPPEGVSLHWSRYVDFGIAGVIGALSVFMPAPQAEALALIVWPALLLVSFLTLSMVMALRLFGPLAASVAILTVVLWRLTGSNYFGPLELDHHGLQILLMAVVVYAIVVEGPELRRGIVGGLAAAVSLAVGLENLLPIAVAGMILAVIAIAPGRPGRGSCRPSASRSPARPCRCTSDRRRRGTGRWGNATGWGRRSSGSWASRRLPPSSSARLRCASRSPCAGSGRLWQWPCSRPLRPWRSCGPARISPMATCPKRCGR
jgi:hypothetical protein